MKKELYILQLINEDDYTTYKILTFNSREKWKEAVDVIEVFKDIYYTQLCNSDENEGFFKELEKYFEKHKIDSEYINFLETMII